MVSEAAWPVAAFRAGTALVVTVRALLLGALAVIVRTRGELLEPVLPAFFATELALGVTAHTEPAVFLAETPSLVERPVERRA
jgi:hypothetical protein